MRRLGPVSGLQLSPRFVTLAWASITAAAVINGQFNVSSITDNSSGDFTFNFLKATKDANYAVVASGIGVQGAGVGCNVNVDDATAPATTAVRMQGLTADVNGVSDTPMFIMVYGDN